MVGQLRVGRMGSFALFACAGALLGGPGRAALQDSKKSPPSQKEISRELAELERDDQKDQNDPSWTETNDLPFVLRQKARRDRVVEIVAAGWLASPEDFDHAALLMQHGQGADDYLLAHVLAIPAGASDQPFGRFLAAATLDRFLHGIDKPQIFSTQTASPDPSQEILMEPFDDSMSESVRALFTLPPLKRAAPSKDEKRSKAPSVKDLPKFLKAAEGQKPTDASAPDKAAEAPDWLLRTREIAGAGVLKTKQDYFLASKVLEHSAQESDLLQAHVLAMAATWLGHEQGLSACASTLDRLLVALGRAPRFGAAGAAPSSTSPPPAPLHAVVLRAYGLGGQAEKKSR